MAKTVIGVLGLPIRKNKQEDKEFLLTQRFAPKFKRVHLKWQLAGGGLEFGETPQQTVVREFEEELNVTPKILDPRPYIITNTWNNGTQDFAQPVHFIGICYLLDIGDQKVTITDPDEETSDWGWYSYNQAMQLSCLKGTQDVIKFYAKYGD